MQKSFSFTFVTAGPSGRMGKTGESKFSDENLVSDEISSDSATVKSRPSWSSLSKLSMSNSSSQMVPIFLDKCYTYVANMNKCTKFIVEK